MAFISDKVKKNSDKCKSCAFMTLRTSKLDRHGVLYDEARVSVEGMIRTSCGMCPYSKDFEKVYGMKPYEYYKVEA